MPESVGVNDNGANGNGHRGLGPTVELVLGKGHDPVPVNGNGHDEGPGATTVAVLLGRVHGRGAVEAEGPQAAARDPLDVRVGVQP